MWKLWTKSTKEIIKLKQIQIHFNNKPEISATTDLHKII